jgi:hypothetical protein
MFEDNKTIIIGQFMKKGLRTLTNKRNFWDKNTSWEFFFPEWKYLKNEINSFQIFLVFFVSFLYEKIWVDRVRKNLASKLILPNEKYWVLVSELIVDKLENEV